MRIVCPKLTGDGVPRAAGAVSLRAAALADKARNHTVKGNSIVEFIGCELFEISHGAGRFLGIKLDIDGVSIFHGDLCVFHETILSPAKEHGLRLGVNAVGSLHTATPRLGERLPH